jgi:hypothetical protein
VAYVSERGGLNEETPLIPVFNAQPYGEIFATRIEDGLTLRLTHNNWEDGLPDWGRVTAKETPAKAAASGPPGEADVSGALDQANKGGKVRHLEVGPSP